jgi:hypothetical protein
MYSSMFLFFSGSALLLGSWWSLLLCPVLLGLLACRTILEERMLEKGLAGYDEYARKMRYRLIPCVWLLFTERRGEVWNSRKFASAAAIKRFAKQPALARTSLDL